MATLTETELQAIEAIPEAERTDEQKYQLVAGRKAGNTENMIPQSRFNEINAAKLKAEADLKVLQDAEDARKKKDLSEIDRLKLEAQQAKDKADANEAALKTERLKNSFVSEAGKLQFGDSKQRFIDTEAAYKLADIKPETTSENAITLLQELAKKNPWMLEVIESKGDRNGTPGKGKKGEVNVKDEIKNAKRQKYGAL